MAGSGDGTPIRYCEQCGRLVRESELREGLARATRGGATFCPECARDSPRPGPARCAPARSPAARLLPPFAVAFVLGAILGGLLMIAGPGARAPIGPPPPQSLLPGGWAPQPVPKAGADDRLASAAREEPEGRTPRALGREDVGARASAPPPEPSRRAAPGPPPAEAPAAQAGEPDDYDLRGMVAGILLKQARDYRLSNPNDLFGWREKLQSLVRSHEGTEAAKEAARLLDEFPLPDLPPGRNPLPPPREAWALAERVLPRVDPDRDAVKGRWTVERGRLRSDRSMWAKIGLPYLVPEEYDVRVVFERVENHDCLLVILARHGRPFIFSIGGAGNTGCSFEDVRESMPDILPTKLVRPGVLSSGQVHEVVILVRERCLRAYLDGTPIVGCQVDDEGLSLSSELAAPRRGQMGFATWDSVYEFLSCDVRPVRGQGEFLRAETGR